MMCPRNIWTKSKYIKGGSTLLLLAIPNRGSLGWDRVHNSCHAEFALLFNASCTDV